MKKVFYVAVFLLIGVVLTQQQVQAQSHQDGDPYLMEKILVQMNDEMNDIPVNIRRIAVYKINYNSLRFTNEEIEFVRGEVEYAFRQYAGLTVLSPPELEPNDKMKIVGSDSTLQILNVRGRSLADVSPEFLNEMTDKYGVQGLVELGVQRRSPEGLVVSLRMMNPDSREVVWTKSFISNPFVIKREDFGKRMVINFGAGSRTGENIFYPDTTITQDSSIVIGDSTLSEVIIDLHATFTYRQPLNSDNSSYIGFTAGLHVLRASKADEFSMTLLEFGTTYYQAISSRNIDTNLYRAMFFLNGNIQLPFGSQSGQIFSASPGLMFNLSENIGLSLYSNFILSGETITLKNNQQVTFNKLSYGVQGVIRF